MVFGFGSSSRASATSNVSVDVRGMHIQRFLAHATFSRGTKQIPTDASANLYETSFAAAQGAEPFTLQIYLSPSFPTQPPIITLLKPAIATHPIINENMQCVRLNGLSSWGNGSVQLVEVIEEIAQSLIAQAPSPVGGASPAKPPSYDTATDPTRRNSRSSSVSSADNMTHIPIPPVPSKFPDLEAMSDSAVTRLLNDDVARATYVENMACVKTIIELKASISDGNVEAAKLNLGREEEIGGLQAEARVMQVELKEEAAKFDKMVKEARGVLDGLSERDVLDLVSSAKMDAEEKSDDLSSSFQDGDLKIGDFVKDYMDMRQKYHERAAKIERLERQQRY
ncbi:hypothetical protein TrVE_jg4353 [Triparma verrucosa]|uniref:VPS37 C-terminal domain-containing protein n=1 Tax=Triparma verrucosa TaxID=1606542 RepID=A0A9W7KXU8_9STRA|nr:hypothetical protein TrVE_jg4353 [Triparma verrucosa]